MSEAGPASTTFPLGGRCSHRKLSPRLHSRHVLSGQMSAPPRPGEPGLQMGCLAGRTSKASRTPGQDRAPLEAAIHSRACSEMCRRVRGSSCSLGRGQPCTHLCLLWQRGRPRPMAGSWPCENRTRDGSPSLGLVRVCSPPDTQASCSLQGHSLSQVPVPWQQLQTAPHPAGSVLGGTTCLQCTSAPAHGRRWRSVMPVPAGDLTVGLRVHFQRAFFVLGK